MSEECGARCRRDIHKGRDCHLGLNTQPNRYQKDPKKKRKKSLNITAHSVNEAEGKQALTLMVKLLPDTNLKNSSLLTLIKFKHVYT